MQKIEKVISRDIPLINIQAWHEGYTYGMEEWLGWGYSDTLFYLRDGFAEILRPPHEHLVIFKEKVIKKLKENPGWLKKKDDEYSIWIDEVDKFYNDVKDISQKIDSEIVELYDQYYKHVRRLIAPYITMVWLPQWAENDKEVEKAFPEQIFLAMNSRKKTETLFTRGDVFVNDILKRISEKTKINLDLLDYLSKEDMISYFINNVVINTEELEKRTQGTLFCKKGIIIVLPNEKKKTFAEVGYEYDDTDYSKLKEVKGNCAYKGKITGRVQLIMNKGNISKMLPGNILVTSMTTPDFLPPMNIASAFVTDEGGITCHAAIVAREMKKPCVIGTKISTKVFKDGDIVEVDADKGIVKIIK